MNLLLEGPVFTAVVLSLMAGVSTGLGGLVAVMIPSIRPGFLSFAMGFASGVMATVSLGDLLPEAYASCGIGSEWIVAGMMAIGMVFAAIIERMLPDPKPDGDAGRGRAMRVGVFFDGSAHAAQSSGGNGDFHGGLPGYRPGDDGGECDYAAQHPRRNLCSGAGMVRHREPDKGGRICSFVRAYRAAWGFVDFFAAFSFYHSFSFGRSVCLCGGHYALYLAGKPFAGRRAIWLRRHVAGGHFIRNFCHGVRLKSGCVKR